MTDFTFNADDEAATDRFGAALAAALPPGTTVALIGTLGAGKTRLVQAIAAASGVSRGNVVSPTFVLCQQYVGNSTINHLDAYRIRDEDELRELGFEELLATRAITIIEWADRVAGALPDDYIQVEIMVTGPKSRQFVARAIGEQYEPVIGELTRFASAQ